MQKNEIYAESVGVNGCQRGRHPEQGQPLEKQRRAYSENHGCVFAAGLLFTPTEATAPALPGFKRGGPPKQTAQ